MSTVRRCAGAQPQSNCRGLWDVALGHFRESDRERLRQGRALRPRQLGHLREAARAAQMERVVDLARAEGLRHQRRQARRQLRAGESEQIGRFGWTAALLGNFGNERIGDYRAGRAFAAAFSRSGVFGGWGRCRRSGGR